MARSFGSPIPRTSLPNLRVNQGLLTRLASPGAGGSIGNAITAALLGVERREREAEDRSTEEASIELLRKAQVAQETGDMRLLNEVRADFDGMLTGTKSKKARELITEGISTIDQQRSATKSQAQTNTAMSILNTEKALEQFKDADARRAAGELVEVAPFEERQRRALEERLAIMKQDPKAVTEASTIQYNTELTALTRQERLRGERGKAVIAALSSVEKGSERYNQIVEQANKLDLGKFVKNFEKTQLELEKLDIEVAKIRDEDPRKPLTLEQKERLAATGYKSSGDPARDRQEFIRLIEAEAKAARAIALRGITEVSGDEATALARQALRDIQREPGADLPLNLFDDLSEEIDDLSDKDLQELLDLSQGKTPVEIRQIAVDWVRNKFSDEFEDMLQVQENEARELDEARDAVDAVIAATNANSGAKPGDANYRDPNDPLVRSAALERLKADAAKQRAAAQAQGVGGRVL